jgi:hypothetical protein
LILVNVETMEDFEPRNNFFTRSLTWNPDGLLDGARHVNFTGSYVWIAADKGLVEVDLDNPQTPKAVTTIPLKNVQASMQQFRYVFAVDAEGLKVIDISNIREPKLVEGAFVPIQNARRVIVSRTYAYVAAGSEGIVIVDIEKPEKPKLYMKYTADGQLNDARDVVVASTNASLFAYVADGKNGLKVVQLTSPESQSGFYGFAPEPKPELVSWRKTRGPALSLSRPLERDRGVDETGHQVAVFGRVGSRPFTLAESQKLYMRDGVIWKVSDKVDPKATGAGSGKCEAKPEVVEQPAPGRKNEATREGRGTSGE